MVPILGLHSYWQLLPRKACCVPVRNARHRINRKSLRRILERRPECRQRIEVQLGSALASCPAVFNTVSSSASELARRTWREVVDDDVLGLAAELSYYFFLALFPAILFLLALASFSSLKHYGRCRAFARAVCLATSAWTDSGADAAPRQQRERWTPHVWRRRRGNAPVQRARDPRLNVIWCGGRKPARTRSGPREVRFKEMDDVGRSQRPTSLVKPRRRCAAATATKATNGPRARDRRGLLHRTC